MLSAVTNFAHHPLCLLLQLARVNPAEANACTNQILHLVSLARLLQGGLETTQGLATATGPTVDAALYASKRSAVVVKPTAVLKIPGMPKALSSSQAGAAAKIDGGAAAASACGGSNGPTTKAAAAKRSGREGGGAGGSVLIGGVRLNKKTAERVMRDVGMEEHELLSMFRHSRDFALSEEQKLAYRNKGQGQGQGLEPEGYKEYKGFPLGTLAKTRNPYGSFTPGFSDASPTNPFKHPTSPPHSPTVARAPSQSNFNLSDAADSKIATLAGQDPDSITLVSQAAARILGRRSAANATANAPYSSKLRELLEQARAGRQDELDRVNDQDQDQDQPLPWWETTKDFERVDPVVSIRAGQVLNATTGAVVSSSVPSLVLGNDPALIAKKLGVTQTSGNVLVSSSASSISAAIKVEHEVDEQDLQDEEQGQALAKRPPKLSRKASMSVLYTDEARQLSKARKIAAAATAAAAAAAAATTGGVRPVSPTVSSPSPPGIDVSQIKWYL